jgi:uncharacterized membrane protein
MFDEILMARNQVPIYYLLIQIWSRAFGTSEFLLRLPSAFFGITNVALVYSLGTLSGHKNVGLWAAWLMATNPFHIWYSREARMYTMAFSLSTESMRLFLLAVQKKSSWQHWMVLTIFSSLAYLTHYVTLAIGLIQLSFFLLTFQKTFKSFYKWVLTQALSVAPAAGWMVLSMLTYDYKSIRPRGVPLPSLLAPAKTFWNFSLGCNDQLTLLTALGLLPFIVVLIEGKGQKHNAYWQIGMLIWLVLPPVLVFVLSFTISSYYMDRYLSICIGAYILWLAASLSTVSQKAPRIILGAILLIAMLVPTIGIISGKHLAKPDWRTAIDQVLKKAQEGDRLLVAQGFHVAFYYANYDLPIEILNGDLPTALDRALREAHREWLLYRDPGVTNSNHVIINANRFNPYESGQSGITEWLSNHNKEICREWFLDGLYLALMESEGCSGKAAKPTAQ